MGIDPKSIDIDTHNKLSNTFIFKDLKPQSNIT